MQKNKCVGGADNSEPSRKILAALDDQLLLLSEENSKNSKKREYLQIINLFLSQSQAVVPTYFKETDHHHPSA